MSKLINKLKDPTVVRNIIGILLQLYGSILRKDYQDSHNELDADLEFLTSLDLLFVVYNKLYEEVYFRTFSETLYVKQNGLLKISPQDALQLFERVVLKIKDPKQNLQFRLCINPLKEVIMSDQSVRNLFELLDKEQKEETEHGGDYLQ